MDAAEKKRLRHEILADARTLLVERFAATEWGRLLVTLAEVSGTWQVESLDVDDIDGDEALVERVFASRSLQDALSPLAHIIEALVVLDGCTVEAVSGGTLVRTHEDTFAFLPGLVRTPSRRFDQARDECASWMNDSLKEFRGAHMLTGQEQLGVDIDAQRIDFLRGSEVRTHVSALLMATFATESRTFAWAKSNPHLNHTVKTAAAKLVDEMEERDVWELSELHFPTDPSTARALCGFVARRNAMRCVLEVAREDGVLWLGVTS